MPQRSALDQTNDIENQTRQALHKQRQKGRFKLKSGPGRPEDIGGDGRNGGTGKGGTRKSVEHSSSLPQIGTATPSAKAGGRRKKSKSVSPKDGAVMMDIESLKSDMFPSSDKMEKQISEAYGELSKVSDLYNSLKHQNETKERSIKALQDELAFLKKEDDVEETSSTLTKEIKKYEAKLLVLEGDFDYVLSYKETLLHMKRRLVEQKTPHSKILKAFEDALKVQFGENEEIKLMARQVLQAKETEERELERRRQELAVERKGWAAKLKDGEALAKKREDMKKWFEDRKEPSKTELLTEKVVVAKLDEASIVERSSNLKAEIQRYHMIFEKMEIVTGYGMDEPEEVANRCNSRKEQSDATVKQEAELTSRMDSLAKENKQLEEELDNLKLVGPGTTEFNREMMDNLASENAKLLEKERTLKSACAKHEFALVEINQTLNNLLRKLSKIKIESPQEHVVEKTDTISYKLETIASKVGRILAEFATMGVPIPTFGDTSVEDVSGLLGLEPLDVQKDSNIRVSAAASPTDAELSKKAQWIHTYNQDGTRTNMKEDKETNSAETEKQRRRDHKKASEKMAKDQGSGLPKNNMKKVISDKSIVAHRGRTSVDIRGRAAIDVRSVISTGTIQEE